MTHENLILALREIESGSNTAMNSIRLISVAPESVYTTAEKKEILHVYHEKLQTMISEIGRLY